MVAFDHELFWAVFGVKSAWLTAIMLAATGVGGGFGLLGLLPLLFHRDGRRLARAVAIAVASQVVLVFGLKQLVGRVRPWQLFQLTVENGPFDPSFPSGHAAGSFATATVCIVWLFRRFGPSRGAYLGTLALAAFATLVAASRVYLGAHFPSDVLAGAVIGSAIGLGVAAASFRDPLGGRPRDRVAGVSDPS